MNDSINPCEDMRDYACGHWLSTHTVPRDESVWNVKQLMKHKHKESLRNLINTMPFPRDVETLEWRVLNMYDSCISLGTVETEGKRPLIKLISKLGGWNVLKDFFIHSWDHKKALKTLHSKYNVQPFFKIDIVPDPQNPIEGIIQISPGNLGLPDKSYYDRHSEDKIVMAYKTFLRDIAITLGATSDDASFFSNNMFGFEKRLAERFPSRLPERQAHYRATIGKLEDIAQSVPIFDVLISMFPEARLNKKSEVVVIASDYLVNVSLIFASTDRSLMNDFMMLKFAVGYLAYLSKPIRNILKEFNQQLYGIKELKPRWEMCVETLQKFVGFGLEAMFEKSDPDVTKKVTVVNDIFQQIRSTIKEAIENSNNLPAHIKDHFLDKLNNIKIQVGLDPSMRHKDYYKVYYSELVSVKDDFFQNVLYGVSFLLKKQQERLSNLADEHKWVDVVSDGQLRVTYIPESNQVVVPIALLSPPYFHPYYPMNILYGGLGTEIGLAIILSITGRGLFHAGDGMMLPPDHPLHNRTHECFIHHPSVTPHLEAIKYTYMALRNTLARMKHVHQPGMENLEDSDIFFLSYAQSICTMKTQEQADVDFRAQHKFGDIRLLDLLMTKSKEYSNTFSCDRVLRRDSCDTLI
ncbi:endothelin-converting enzyme 1-like isoform X2 [Cimex lectularius]|nr:endothelin-converting enzyme 1-like isoform X2 [Cimex lectularius]XP_024084990.1 endothelin-converting enzyme 1-like isoform X2 [Cimex lectularius]